MHSLFLHGLPPVFCYMVRWREDLAPYGDKWGFLELPAYSFKEAMVMLLTGLIFYAFWVMCYTIIVHILSY